MWQESRILGSHKQHSQSWKAVTSLPCLLEALLEKIHLLNHSGFQKGLCPCRYMLQVPGFLLEATFRVQRFYL